MDNGRRVLMQLHLQAGAGATVIKKILSFVALQAGLSDDYFFSQDFINCPDLNRCFDSLIQFRKEDWISKVGFSERIAIACVEALKNYASVMSEFRLAEDNGIEIVTLLDATYPLLLRTIYAPPPVLYVKGELPPPSQKCLAVVGARVADGYARDVLSAVLPPIIGFNWCIVSGGARGADSFAHEITIEAGGKTVVVLGAGLLVKQPSYSIELFNKVLATGGCVLSIFPLLLMADKSTFPTRNRVVAGMSQGCVVVQAAKRSGALITAQCAIEEGRQVFAVPGALFSPLSEGCNELIAQGAHIVTGLSTILEVLEGVGVESSVQQNIIDFSRSTTMTINDNKKNPFRQKEECPILLQLHRAMSVDDLVRGTSFSPEEIQEKLFDMQINGLVRQNFAGLWERL